MLPEQSAALRRIKVLFVFKCHRLACMLEPLPENTASKMSSKARASFLVGSGRKRGLGRGWCRKAIASSQNIVRLALLCHRSGCLSVLGLLWGHKSPGPTSVVLRPCVARMASVGPFPPSHTAGGAFRVTWCYSTILKTDRQIPASLLDTEVP